MQKGHSTHQVQILNLTVLAVTVLQVELEAVSDQLAAAERLAQETQSSNSMQQLQLTQQLSSQTQQLSSAQQACASTTLVCGWGIAYSAFVMIAVTVGAP